MVFIILKVYWAGNLLIATVLFLLVTFVFTAGLIVGPGPAPNSGDGVPDGPGW